MNYEVLKKDDITIIKINMSQATREHSKEFSTLLVGQIQKEKARKIIIDFDSVYYVDSSFLGGLVGGLKEINRVKGDIKVINLHPSVRSLFEITRLYKVFEVFNNVEDAVLSF